MTAIGRRDLPGGAAVDAALRALMDAYEIFERALARTRHDKLTQFRQRFAALDTGRFPRAAALIGEVALAQIDFLWRSTGRAVIRTIAGHLRGRAFRGIDWHLQVSWHATRPLWLGCRLAAPHRARARSSGLSGSRGAPAPRRSSRRQHALLANVARQWTRKRGGQCGVFRETLPVIADERIGGATRAALLRT